MRLARENTLEGIVRLWQQEEVPELILPYLEAVGSLNTSDELRYYPGSPLLAAKLLREQDLLMLTELHPTDFPLLRTEFSRDKRESVSGKMVWTIKIKTPPVSRRGFAFN